MHESPAESITRIRLERARHLMIIDATIPLLRVAADCGFSSLSAFSRAFSKHFGQAATQYSLKLRSHLQGRSDASLEVEVVTFAGALILYEHTSMMRGTLLQDFHKAQTVGRKKGVKITGRKFGVMTHLAFHAHGSHLNYYAGVEITFSKTVLERSGNVFVIPHGTYARFFTDSPHEELRSIFMQFKLQWLDKSKYMISDTFSFEEFLEKPGSLRRHVYVPLKLKSIRTARRGQ